MISTTNTNCLMLEIGVKIQDKFQIESVMNKYLLSVCASC
jgi:hypothetical protein